MSSMILMFVFYAALVLSIGIIAGRRSQNTSSEIHLGGRKDSAIVSGLSAGASTESGFVMLGMVGAGYALGTNALWIVPAGIIGYLINWLILAPRIHRFSIQSNSVTVPEFIFARTGGSALSRLAAAAAAIAAIVFLISYAAAQINASGKTMSAQFDISYVNSMLLGAVIVLVYSSLGGYRAIAWTDTLQAAMMFFALLVLPAIVIIKVGGVGELFAKLASIDPLLVDPLRGATSYSGQLTAVIAWLMLGLAYPGQPHAIARLMAMRDENLAKSASLVGIIWFVAIYTGAVLLGMGARVAFADVAAIAADSERILPVLAVSLLPGIFSGMIVAAIFAAIASTADSALFSATSSIVRDIPNSINIRLPGREVVWTRFVLVALSLISVGFALRQEGLIFDLVLYAWSGLGASLGPVVLYCALFKRPTAASALAGVVIGLIAAVVLKGLTLNLLLAFSLSLLAIAIAHTVENMISGDAKKTDLTSTNKH